MQYVEFPDGIFINGEFPSPEVNEIIGKYAPYNLILTDPPYGRIVNQVWDKANDDVSFAKWMLDWTQVLTEFSLPGGALYVWGGIGRPNFRPFYRYLVGMEEETNWRLANHITWSKKRAYGVQHNYIFTREECAYFVLGDIKKPRIFNLPLLETKRGYAGYNKKYPAKSEFYRRTNVWTDITEILKGKIHECQKPEKLFEIPIETHTRPGDYILDPFAGSGTLAIAARKLGRKFVMIEKYESEFNKAVERINSFQI